MRYCFVVIILFCLAFFALNAEQTRLAILENFESGSVNLTSYPAEDIAPSAWSLDQTYTYNGSLYALKLSGNTWKQESITPLPIAPGNVLQGAIRNSGTTARIQGIGFSNGTHTLFYSVDGTAVLNIEQWVTVYQGAFSTSTWNLYQFPIAADWYAYFDETPTLTSIVYINDLDSGSGSTWFDDISLLTSEVHASPQVTITYNIVSTRKVNKNTRDLTVSFNSVVQDSDSSVFTYNWDFGDSTRSFEANPTHNFTVTDGHAYSVLLRVEDETGQWGLARSSVNVDIGEDSLPITLNFVGDVMLARDYEAAGGIIPSQGVNAIFQPTKYLLGDAADITDINLEVVLTNQGTPHPTKSVCYRGSPANLSGLLYAGVDIVGVGNNHVMDYGWTGLHQMLDSLSAHGIAYSGSGINSYDAYTPAFTDKNGLNIAWLRATDRTGQYNNAQPYLNAGYNKPGVAYLTPYYLSQQLAAVDSVADLKIMEMHGGSEYSLTPGSGYDRSAFTTNEYEDEDYSLYTDVPHLWDIALRHYAIDQGADMVIVHHPHILQGLEIYNGKLIAHSLGNFVFDLTYPETMPTMILYADAGLDGFSNYRVVPCFLDDYIPRRANAKLGIRILDYLAKRSRDLNTYLYIDRDNVTASVVVDTTDLDFYPTVTEEVIDPEVISTGIYGSEPFLLKRSGSISSLDYISPGSAWQARLGSECVWTGNMEDEGANLFSLSDANETFTTQFAHEGLRSLALNATTASASVPLKYKMKWYDNTRKFTLHAWIRTRNAAGVNIDIQYFNNRTATSPYSTESLLATALTGNSEWTFYQKEITIPSACTFYNIVLKTTGGFGYFDEVGLIDWNPWQDVSQMQSIPYPNDYYWAQVQSPDNPKCIRVAYTEKEMQAFESERRLILSEIPFTALGNYPNPFNPMTTISFSLKKAIPLTLNIYNLKGQRVRTLLNSELTSGPHTVKWDGKDSQGKNTASGIYFYRLSTTQHSVTKKIILLK